MTSEARFSPTFGAWTLGALGLGLVLGMIGKAAEVTAIGTLAEAIAPLGTLWINALQMTVILLVVTQLLVAIVRSGGTASVGKLAGKAVAFFLMLLVGAGLMTLLLTPWLLQFYHVAPDVASALRVEWSW